MSPDKTIATLPLLGGTCTDTQTVTVSLDPTQVTDSDGNKGVGTSVSNTYTVSTVGPSASLSPPLFNSDQRLFHLDTYLDLYSLSHWRCGFE